MSSQGSFVVLCPCCETLFPMAPNTPTNTCSYSCEQWMRETYEGNHVDGEGVLLSQLAR